MLVDSNKSVAIEQAGVFFSGTTTCMFPAEQLTRGLFMCETKQRLQHVPDTGLLRVRTF